MCFRQGSPHPGALRYPFPMGKGIKTCEMSVYSANLNGAKDLVFFGGFWSISSGSIPKLRARCRQRRHPQRQPRSLFQLRASGAPDRYCWPRFSFVCVSLFLLRQSKQLVAIADEEDSVGGYWSRVYGATHVHLRKHLLLLTGLQNNDV